MSLTKAVGIVIPTYNAEKELAHCLPPLIASPLHPKICIIDSSSTDQTAKIAQQMGAEVIVIPKKSFGHGTTRDMGRRYLNTPIVVYLTQDAYAEQPETLEKLIEPISSGKAAVAYGRQLPRPEASLKETFHRHFNYPEKSQLRTLQDLPLYGKYTYFCSNSFAAYDNEALESVGGFRRVLFGEDTLAAADLLRKGHAIAYVAEARVYHSHKTTLRREFQRYFDIGYVRNQFASLLEAPENDSSRGKSYAKQLLKEVAKKAPYDLPYTFLLLTTRWLAYQCGKRGDLLPKSCRRMVSSHKGHWI